MKIHFNHKIGLRERQLDTSKYCPYPHNIVHYQNNLQTHKHHNNYFRKIILKVVAKIPLIKFEKNPSGKELTYIWGGIPINKEKPFIIELDNPYCLTYYNKTAFQLYKKYIRRVLKSKQCIKIICISDACKNKLISLLGKSIEHKIRIQYPYVKNLPKSQKNNKTRFLFVGFDFDGKGGKELLNAMQKIKDPKIQLTIVGPEINKIKNFDKRITLLGKQPREKILNSIIPEHDILIFPTYYESLGMVALEALSAGLGIITTNTFALPELVKHKKNGYLINNPFLKPVNLNGEKIVDPTEMRLTEFKKKYAKQAPSKELEKNLVLAIKEAIDKKEYWKENSRILFEQKFSPKIWVDNFKKVFE